MNRFFTRQAESLTEMAAPKMPEGTKRSRSKTYAHVNDIHIGGEHVATISGHRVHERGAPAHAKEYTIHRNEEEMIKGIPHPSHAETKNEHVGYEQGSDGEANYHKPIHKDVQRSKRFGSMEDAVHAVVHQHHNDKEFGVGHDPRVRWQKAADSVGGVQAHNEKTHTYHHAISHAKLTGHQDVVDLLEKHKDAHIAAGAGNGIDSKKIDQWTHDAHQYVGHSYNHKTRTNEPNNPEHRDLAASALEARRHALRQW